LIITPLERSTITVDNIEVAQFVYLLLSHEKIRDVINSVTKRGVLILGRFEGNGLEILQSIASELRSKKYLPIIFNFNKPDARDYTETIKILVGLSRFVVVDISGPSVPQELYATVPFFDIPFVPIIDESRKPYSMYLDLYKYSWFLPIVNFSSKDQLIKRIPLEVIFPAEEKCKERQRDLDRIFPS